MLVAVSRDKRLAWSHLALSAAAMFGLGLMLAGQSLVGEARAEGDMGSAGGGWNAFNGELSQDYPEVFAQRKAIMACRPLCRKPRSASGWKSVV